LIAEQIDTKPLTRTIERYNLELIRAARNGDVSPLKPLATDRIVQKTYAWIHSWQDSNYYMRSKLEKINYLSFSSTENNHRQVQTKEEWIYDYYDAGHKKEAMPRTRTEYRMVYSLFYHKGHWIIEEIKIISEKETLLEKLIK